MSFFISTFSPFYPPDHPRHSPRHDSAFIFLQPEISFDHHGVTASNPKRWSIKESIRANFEKRLSRYSVELVEQPIEALKYVKPFKVDGEPVRWWSE